LVAHTGWHWMLDRGARLWLYQFQWPAIDAALMVFVLRWLILAVAVAGVGWVIFTAARALPKLASASEGGSGPRGERDRIRPTGEGASV
jgi:hypothetical protein